MAREEREKEEKKSRVEKAFFNCLRFKDGKVFLFVCLFNPKKQYTRSLGKLNRQYLFFFLIYFSVDQCFSTCSINISWRFVTKADSLAPPQTYGLDSEILGMQPDNLTFNKPSRRF